MATLLTGGTVVTGDGSRRADVRIDQGVVTDAGGPLPGVHGDEVVDCTGCLVLPGGVETHTHLDLEAGQALTADDFASGSRAALAGGTTTVLDFATAFHGQSLPQGLARWHAKADGKAVCDYGFHMAMTQWRPEFAEQMQQVADAGVTSFKMYLAYRHSMMVEDDEVHAALQAASRLGATIGFHCENGRIIDVLVNQALAQGHTGAYWHQHTRPASLEAEALGRLTTIAGLLDAEHYVVHLSSRASLEPLRAARARGSKVIAETCPQYLLLDASRYGTGDGEDELAARQYVMSPPLRSPADNEALWRALADGQIQFVGTDHCSFRLKGQKDAAADFAQVPNGAPGIELRLQLLYTEGVAAGRLTPQRFVEVTATNAAKYFGLYPRKGTIRAGSDADIVVYDPRPTGVVTHAGLHDACDHTPYEGHRTIGQVRDVFLRGHRAVRDGRLARDLPPGQFLRCGPPDSAIT